MKKTISCLMQSSALVLFLSGTVGCLQNNASSPSGTAEVTSSSLSQDITSKASPVHLLLTDNPTAEYKNVMVKVKELEVILAKGDKAAKVILSEDVGFINLMDFQSGIMMNLSKIDVPNGVFIREIRMRLEDNASYLTRLDGSICQLQTPSAEKSGLKLKLPDSVQIETGYSYNIVVNFNASKSIVNKGNGGCLLKPVLKLQTATRSASNNDPSSEEPIPDDNPSTGGSDSSTGGSSDSGSNGNSDSGTTDGSDQDSGSGYQEGVDYILDGDMILIPQPDGSYIVVEGVDLSVISIEEILSYFL